MSASEAPSRDASALALRVLRGLTYALGGVLLVLSAWVVIQRFRHPTDGEWMVGAVRDAVERVRDGEQIYVAPSARFIPFVYPPLYFWLSGLLARICSTALACKLVSIGSTLAAGWGIWRIARALGATPFWSRIALLLLVATYPLTLLFYDLERVDALYAGLVVVGLAVLLSGRSLAHDVTAGLLLGLAFYAKQAGLLAFAAASLGLVLAGERRRALVVGVTGLAVLVSIGVYLEISTDGWFRYYCWKLPRSHGIRPQRLSLFFIVDLPNAFAITAGSVAMSAPALWSLVRRRSAPAGESWRGVVFAAVIAASMAASFSFRAHSGGWENVLIAWLPLGCAATAVAATRAERRARDTNVARLVPVILLGGVSLQLLHAMFDPMELSPNADDVAERRRFVALVRELETEGEVIVTTTGSVTAQTSAHAAALYDILRAGDRAPADLLEGLAERRYAALFLGIPDEYDCRLPGCEELVSTIIRNYFIAGRRHERERSGMTGYDARPRWLLRPRKQPLPETSVVELRLRQGVEKGLAEAKTAQTPPDTEITPADDVEELAAREIRAWAARPSDRP